MGGVGSSVTVGWGPTGSSSSSEAEWTLSSSLGGAGESSGFIDCVCVHVCVCVLQLCTL